MRTNEQRLMSSFIRRLVAKHRCWQQGTCNGWLIRKEKWERGGGGSLWLPHIAILSSSTSWSSYTHVGHVVVSCGFGRIHMGRHVSAVVALVSAVVVSWWFVSCLGLWGGGTRMVGGHGHRYTWWFGGRIRIRVVVQWGCRVVVGGHGSCRARGVVSYPWCFWCGSVAWLLLATYFGIKEESLTL